MSKEAVKVPDIGGADEVEVIEVLVAAGDEVVPEQSLIVLESDKASMEIPSPSAGIVAELKVSVGDKVSEGHDILVLDAESTAPTTQADVLEATAPEPPGGEQPLQEDDPPVDSTATRTETVPVPDIGGAEGVSVIEVCVSEGDEIAVEDPIVVLESDKASMEIPSPAAGKVARIIVQLDGKVSEGDPLIELVVGGASAPGAAAVSQNQKKSAPSVASAPEPDAAELTDKPPVPSKPASYAPQTSVHAGPAVRRLAREFGVDLARVSGSGRKGRVLKEDIQQYVRDMLARGGSGEAAGAGLPEMPEVDFSRFGPVEEVELSKINKLSAKNLHRSWLHVPHVTQFDDADITELENFRKEHNTSIPAHGVKLTLLPFIVKACAGALTQHPRFNTSLHPSGEKLIQKQYCHIGIAVDTPGGLVVPVIRDVPEKGIYDLARECGALAEKARNKRLSPADMQGACFSISSLGGIGGTAFTPIVNAPEVAILGVSKSSFQPVYNGSSFEPRLMLPLCLSYDHRVIDGALAARFVTTLSGMLGDIRHLLL